MVDGQVNTMRIKPSQDCIVWEMQRWRSKARVRSAVLKEIKGAVGLVTWLWHLLWPVSGKGLKDEVRIKGYSPSAMYPFTLLACEFLEPKYCIQMMFYNP